MVSQLGTYQGNRWKDTSGVYPARDLRGIRQPDTSVLVLVVRVLGILNVILGAVGDGHRAKDKGKEHKHARQKEVGIVCVLVGERLRRLQWEGSVPECTCV